MATGDKSCLKCKGEGRIVEKDGTIHICYDCLSKGFMDQHNKEIKDASELGFKI